MLRVYIWLRLLIKCKEIFIKYGVKYGFYCAYYNKLINEKNYKSLKNKYNTFYKIFFKKNSIKSLDTLFDQDINLDIKLILIYDNAESLLKLSFFQLEFLYNYFRFFGSIEISLNFFEIINKKTVNKYINKSSLSKKEISRLLNTLIYLNDTNNLKKIISNNLLSISDHYKDLYNIFEIKKYKSRFKSDNFYKYINKKKVFIIGPNYIINKKNNNYENGIFVFSNFTNYAKLNVKNKICYLNSFKVNHFFKNIIEKKNNYKWISLKNTNDYNKFNMFKNENFRISNDSSILYNNGSPMLIQNIIFDLLNFCPNKIYLDGIDFYLFGSSSNYEYKKYDRDLLSISKSIREHDILENKKIVDFLVKNNFIETDYILSQIVKLDDKYFSRMLDYHYKNYTY